MVEGGGWVAWGRERTLFIKLHTQQLHKSTTDKRQINR